MNIVCYINRVYGGGAERVMSVLVNELSKRGHTVHLVTDYTAQNEYAISPDVARSSMDGEFSRHKGNALLRTFRRISKLRKICIEENADILISFMREANFKAVLATSFMKTKSIISVRIDPASAYRTKLQGIIAICFYSIADACVFQTNQVLQWYPQWIQKHARVIINPIESSFFDIKEPTKRKKEIISYGRLSRQKRFDLLINAFASVIPEHPEFHLTIYGDGDQRADLEKLIAQYGIESKVSLPGRSHNIASDTHDAYAFVLSSDYEGLPNGLMEAMAMGLPVISTDCKGGGARAIVQNGINGILVSVNDEAMMADALREYMDHEETALEMGRKQEKQQRISKQK